MARKQIPSKLPGVVIDSDAHSITARHAASGLPIWSTYDLNRGPRHERQAFDFDALRRPGELRQLLEQELAGIDWTRDPSHFADDDIRHEMNRRHGRIRDCLRVDASKYPRMLEVKAACVHPKK